MNGGEMQNFAIVTESFGAEVLCRYHRENTQKITKYIRNQLKEDAEQSLLTMDFNPFTGSK